MSEKINSVSKNDIRGTASGVLFMAFFGTMWSYTGTIGLKGLGKPWVLIISLIIGLGLIGNALLLISKSSKLSNENSNPPRNNSKNIRFWFNIVFALEFIAIYLAVFLLNRTSNTELVPIVIAIIVGIHFLPLAYLFQIKMYYLTGILITLIALITWLFIPLNSIINGNEIDLYLSVVGFGSAIILWITGFFILQIGRRLLVK